MRTQGSKRHAGAWSPVHPEYRWRRDVPILLVGGILLLAGTTLSVTRQVVPAEGLDANWIHWAFDRSVIGNASTSTSADRDSSYFRAATLGYLLVLAFASQPSGSRLHGALGRSLAYLEAVSVGEGIGIILKYLSDRPRPFNYLPADQRPDTRAFDVTSPVAFESMPSGHALSSFMAAAFAMTDHLLTRPTASWQEQVGVSALGGFLASLTATLRVEAGQHFPSDVIVGGLIGTGSGVAAPLVRHYVTADGRRAPFPSGRAWRRAIAGQVVGIAAGIMVGHLTY